MIKNEIINKALHLPEGFKGFFDYNQAISFAIQENKPLFVDFTGHACVNCRKMEEQVWSDSKIKNILSNDIVLVSLYVDERIDLPLNEQYETTLAGKVKKVKTNYQFQNLEYPLFFFYCLK